MCNRDANRQLIKAREESQVMPNRNGRGRYRGPARSRSRRRSRRNLGALIAAGSFTSVSSSWAQPAVSCGGTDTFSASAFWAGLDGDGTPTVEQAGTEADCDGGTASYQGWYEIFPNAPVFYPDPVQPGDDMSASVVADGDGIFTLTLSDATQGWTQARKQAEPDAQLGSAEVIAEAPSNGTVLPLADFGTVNFTGVTVDNAPIGAGPNLSELTLSAPDGTALATPSALTAGNAFSVTSAGPVTPGPGTSDGPGASGGEWYQG